MISQPVTPPAIYILFFCKHLTTHTLVIQLSTPYILCFHQYANVQNHGWFQHVVAVYMLYMYWVPVSTG